MLHYICYVIGLNHVDLMLQVKNLFSVIDILMNIYFLGNCLQQALRKIGKENIVHNCVFNIEWVTDAAEKELAKARLTSRGGSVDGTAISGRRVCFIYYYYNYNLFLLLLNSWMKVLKVMMNMNVVDMENLVSKTNYKFLNIF